MNYLSRSKKGLVNHRKIEAKLRKIGEKLLRLANRGKRTKKQYFEIIFLSDQKMRALKKRFFKKAGKSHKISRAPRKARRTRGKALISPPEGNYSAQRKLGERSDVLAFPEPSNFPHPEKKGQNLGEIYLNSRLLNRFDRLVILMVHGLLHLLGYTHDRKSDTIRMEQIERRLIKKSGLAFNVKNQNGK
jgi:ssRNA-specific RNase YbeY (16S rRNA maturation enzyme)